jgi:hypothetical protein
MKLLLLDAGIKLAWKNQKKSEISKTASVKRFYTMVAKLLNEIISFRGLIGKENF